MAHLFDVHEFMLSKMSFCSSWWPATIECDARWLARAVIILLLSVHFPLDLMFVRMWWASASIVQAITVHERRTKRLKNNTIFQNICSIAFSVCHLYWIVWSSTICSITRETTMTIRRNHQHIKKHLGRALWCRFATAYNLCAVAVRQRMTSMSTTKMETILFFGCAQYTTKRISLILLYIEWLCPINIWRLTTTWAPRVHAKSKWCSKVSLNARNAYSVVINWQCQTSRREWLSVAVGWSH